MVTESNTTGSAVEQGAYRVNIVCFTAVAVLYTIWFQRHLKVYVTETLLIGGTLSLLGLWKLVWDAVGLGGGDKPDDWIRRVLKGPHVREYLAFAAALLIVLYAATSSIYLSYGNQTRGQSQFNIEVWDGNRMVMPPVELSPFDRDQGRPFFFRWSRPTLEYRIVKPSGYQVLRLKWAPWSQHRLSVPDDFAPKELHLLRIFPGAALAAQLPTAADAPGATFALEITSNKGPVTIKPLTKGLILAGMGADDLKAVVSDAELAATRAAVDAYFAARGFPPEARESTVAKIMDGRKLWATPEWTAGDQLQLRVVRHAPAMETAEVVLDREYSIPSEAGRVHDIVLDPG